MADIARDVGITPGAIYRYFPTKFDLIACCFSESEESVAQRWKEPIAPGVDPLQQLGELARMTFSHLHRPEERADTIIHLQYQLELVQDEDAEGIQRIASERDAITALVAGRLVAAKEQGSLPKEIDPRLLAEALISFWWGARLAHMLEPDADTDGQLEQLLRLIGAASNRGAAAS
jgi:AcrR family transcriptional regulator